MVAFRGGASVGVTENAFGGAYLGDDEFLRASAAPAEIRQAEILANPGHTVVQGTLIEATLEVAINSDLPGVVSAVVSYDVWSFDMARVLIPRGSKLYGRCNFRCGCWSKAHSCGLEPDHHH